MVFAPKSLLLASEQTILQRCDKQELDLFGESGIVSWLVIIGIPCVNVTQVDGSCAA